MAAVTGALPPLSAVRVWDTQHLTTAAQHWESKASSWESAFTEVYLQMPNPGGTPWSGAAAEAAHLRAHRDRSQVFSVVDELHGAATTARNGAIELEGAKQRVLSAVNTAQSAGFRVGDDYSVSYPHRVKSPAEAAVRQAQAQTMAADIRSRAGTLAATDHEVASRISAAATSVGKLDFKERPPGADALSVKNAKDVHRIVDPLPPGRNPGVKTAPKGALPGIYGTLTENATPVPPGTYPGQVAVLDDGTRISFRPDSKSGGATIDIRYPDGTTVKIHEFDPPPTSPPPPAPVPAPAPAPEPAPAPSPDSPGLHLPDVDLPAPSPEQSGPLAAAGGIVLAILLLGGMLLA